MATPRGAQPHGSNVAVLGPTRSGFDEILSEL